MNAKLKKIGVCLALLPWLSLLAAGRGALAQVILPAEDGVGTIVTPQGETGYDITGGQRSGDGDNLFHSFAQFGVNAGEVANFLSTPEIANIFGRISAGDPSVINGVLQVTGGASNLFLLNPAGVLFGPNASLNLPASFMATTATGIGFDGGLFPIHGNFDAISLNGVPSGFVFDSVNAGSLVNTADLAVTEGATLSLMAGSVINSGTLTAPGGTLTLTAIPTTPTGEAMVRISQEGSLLSLDVPVDQLSALQAQGTVASLPELLTYGPVAQGIELSLDDAGNTVVAVAEVAVPTAPGTAIASNTLDVSAATGGGQVQVLGQRVGLVAADINAAGTTGDGGTVLIGGDATGSGEVFNAEQTYVSGDSTVNVGSLVNGNGGRAIVWADQTTQFAGTILAQGGSAAGNGGFVEVSGKEQLNFTGTVELGAIQGDPGTLLLDPSLIVIGDPDLNTQGNQGLVAGQDDGLIVNNQVLADFDDTDMDGRFVISQAAFEGLTGDVILQATEEIRFGLINDANPATPAAELFFNGNSLTLETTTANAAAGGINAPLVAPGSSPTNDGRNRFELVTNGADVTFRANLVQDPDARISIVTGGGDVLVETFGDETNGIPGGRIFLAPVDTSSDTGAGGDITLRSNGSNIQLLTTADRLIPLDASGVTGGGNVVVEALRTPSTPATSRTDAGAPVDTSTVTGAAGNVTFRAENVGANASSIITINASSDNGTAGNILLESIDSEGVIGPLGDVVAMGNPDIDGNPTGNVTISANEFDSIFSLGTPDLPLPGTDIVLPGEPPAVVQLTGFIRLQPLDPGRTIRVGASGGADDPNALDLTQGDLGILGSPGSFADQGIFIGVENNTTPSQIILEEVFPFASATTIDAGPGSELIGPVDPNGTFYTVTGGGEGTISGFTSPGSGVPDLRFTNIGAITASNTTSDDTLVFSDGGVLPGATFVFDGGAGNNVLDFSDYTTALNVNLARTPAVALAADVDAMGNINPTAVPIIEGEVRNITGVIGGSQSDIIIGDDNPNVLGGGPGGNDQLIGGGGIDTIRETANADFTLTDTLLSISSTGETDTLESIEIAELIGGADANQFNLQAWTGSATIDGLEGDDTYTLNFLGAGNGTFVISDSGTTSNDVLTVVGTAEADTITLTTPIDTVSPSLRQTPAESTLTLGNETITLIDGLVSEASVGIDSLALDGAEGGDTYLVNSGSVEVIPTTINDSGTAPEAGGDLDTIAVSLISTGLFADDRITLSDDQIEIRTGTQDTSGGFSDFIGLIAGKELITYDYSNIEGISLNTGLGDDQVTVSELNLASSLSVQINEDEQDISPVLQDIFIEDILAVGEISLRTDGGSILGTGTTLSSAQGNVNLAASDIIQVDTIESQAGNVTVDGGLQVSSSVTAAENIVLEATNGSILSPDATVFTSNGDVDISALGVIQLGTIETPSGSVNATATTGPLQVGSSVTAEGSIRLSATESSILSPAAVLSTATGDVELSARDAIEVGNIETLDGSVAATTEVGPLQVGATVTAEGSISFSAAEGSILSPDTVLSAQGNVNLVASDTIQVDTIESQAGNVTVDGGLQVSSSVTAAENIVLEATNGSILSPDATVFTSNGDVDVSALGVIQLATIDASSGSVSAATETGPLQVGATVAAQGSISLSATESSILSPDAVLSSTTGDVALSARDRIEVGAIETQGGNIGVSVSEGQFQVTSLVTGTNASIVTGGGSVDIEFFDDGIIPFTVPLLVGPPTENGTAGFITAGINTVFGVAVSEVFVLGNISIVNLFEPLSLQPFNSLALEILDELAIVTVLPESCGTAVALEIEDAEIQAAMDTVDGAIAPEMASLADNLPICGNPFFPLY